MGSQTGSRSVFRASDRRSKPEVDRGSSRVGNPMRIDGCYRDSITTWRR